jgi:hypothetical protein
MPAHAVVDVDHVFHKASLSRRSFMTAQCTALGVGALLALTPAPTLAVAADAPLTVGVELHAAQPGVITFSNPLGRSRGPGGGFGNL